ncbi:brain tumor protein [Trichogramma pretiosum]|uniref:brain tumor protein n=1 Tax=Trichogramma pretiosum TaxID=7493 RepID=UPI0006C9C74C|nr:brain tumor protein [Trichogramma pretiosum]XP_014232641.1 brain tumor protein [Trichogramma pretiosum]XP_023317451.1 brain tumor protein [Trichogramma pretiosum]XP_023317452.1 brain tumor protein [Trichogramma pretiosum]
MASPTPSLESRANSLGSLASLSPLTVSGSSPPASDSAIGDVDSCDLCLDAPLNKQAGDTPCPRCRGGSSSAGASSLSSNSSTTTTSNGHLGSSGVNNHNGNSQNGSSGNNSNHNNSNNLHNNNNNNSQLLNGNSGSSQNLATTINGGIRCTGCKSNESDAVARCFDCANFLCPNCVMAHQFMHCFEGHRVLNLGDSKISANNPGNSPGGQNESSNNAGLNNGQQQQQVVSSNGQDNNSGKQIGSQATNNVVQSLVSGTTSLLINGGGGSNGEKVLLCSRHKSEVLKYFCRTCSVPICKECTGSDHPSPMHDYASIADIGPQQLEIIARTIQECRSKANEVRAAVKTADHGAARLQVQYHKAQNEINDTFQFYRSMLEERKQELLKELESIFSAKQISLSVLTQKANDMADKMQQTCDFVDRLTKYTTPTEVLMVKKLLDAKLQLMLSYNPDINSQAADLEFVSNYQAIQVGVRNTFGYVRSSSEANSAPQNKQPPIARPTALNSTGSSIGNSSNASSGPGSSGSLGGLLLDRPYSNGLISSGSNCNSSTSPSPFENAGCVISKRFSSANSLGPFSTSISDLNINGMNNPYEKWSNGSSDSYQVSVNSADHFPVPAITAVNAQGAPGDSVLDLTSKLIPPTAIFPLKSQIKRQKMIYHCKFGEFGVMEGQFTEPSGVAVNAQNDIIVADTNNHRIQIFDKEGRFKFQFGECGKRDGQLLYPNRVAVVRTSGDIIVTERSPTHQIQIYNQYGQFVRKFGANILQHPRGVTVDSKGRIVVVECKVMRVIIFDQAGNVLQKFGCSKHLEFPNGVVVNDKQEIFISDNRAHCVKVFDYEGAYLRQIGGEGITNYPIGVGINGAGEILIADNHNNFNLTIFTQDGQLVSALESKVKHAQCFDVALMDDGSVVLASKDYRLYIYRYVQVPPIGI